MVLALKRQFRAHYRPVRQGRCWFCEGVNPTGTASTDWIFGNCAHLGDIQNHFLPKGASFHTGRARNPEARSTDAAKV